MKTFFRTFGLALALALALFAEQGRAQDNTAQADTNAQANDNVSFQTFYDQLANQGTWVQTDQYGYVFQPTESDPNWRPYTYGHWVNTDAGMTWDSDEPFGWATYHYGRWVNLNGYGWVWVPGYTWAPAWVSWRQGDDDVGWAPLPPDSDEGIDYYGDDDYFTGFDFGFHIGDDCDIAYGIGPWCYNFCPVAFIGDPDCWRHFRDHRDNFGFIGHTRNVTNINFHRDGAGRFARVHAEGPSVAALNGRARTPIENARLTSASRLGNAGLHGNSLAVFAPRVDPATMKTARPASVGERLANTSVNRGTDINHPLAVNSRVSPAGATAEQIHAATLAQGNMSGNAKIATANMRISRPLTQPLTSLRTNTRSNSGIGTGARPTGVAGTSRGAASSASAESRFTGEPATEHGTFSSSGESRFTGEPITHRAAISSPAESRFTGEAPGSQAVTPSHTTSTYRHAPSYSTGGSYAPSSVYHPSASIYHSQQPSFQRSESMFNSSAPAYHPQSSFHSFAPAPQPHFSGGGGGFQRSAPASQNFSGGGFGGGRPSGGGGGGFSHASAGGGGGGGHAGGGGGRH